MRKIILSEKKMTNFLKFTALFLIVTCVFSFSGCKKADDKTSFQKENAGGTGYGAAVKSELYIEDFYFLTVGTEKAKVELLTGDAQTALALFSIGIGTLFHIYLSLIGGVRSSL